jgi:ABC-2 type transport system permease protein
MNLFRDTGLFFGRAWLARLRNPTWLVVGFSTPVLYLVLFTPLLKELPGVKSFPTGSVLEVFLPGILALLAFTSGANAGFGIIFEMQLGIIERFRVTPASRLAILTGPILCGLVMMTAFDAVVVVVGVAFGFSVNWGGLAVLLILLWLLAALLAAFSTALALLTGEISSFAAIVGGIQLPIMLTAGVLLPISLGPTWLKVIAHFNPLYYLVEASRALATGHFGDPAIWQAFVVLIPLCVLVMAWATSVFRKAVA